MNQTSLKIVLNLLIYQYSTKFLLGSDKMFDSKSQCRSVPKSIDFILFDDSDLILSVITASNVCNCTIFLTIGLRSKNP